MTVRELIAALEQCDPDRVVAIVDADTDTLLNIQRVGEARLDDERSPDQGKPFVGLAGDFHDNALEGYFDEGWEKPA